MSKLLRVQARDGVAVPFPRAIKAAAGARPFVLRGKGVAGPDGAPLAEADDPVEVADDPFVRKRLRAGDLVLAPAAPASSRSNARAPKSADLAAPPSPTLGKE